MEIKNRVEGLRRESEASPSLAQSAESIRETFAKYLTWLAIAILFIYCWTIDAKHPPNDLIEKIGRIEGKLDAVIERLNKTEKRE